MQHSCFRLEKQHVGQKTLRLEGRRVRLPFRIRTEDIGREVCFTPNGAIRLSELQITADQYPVTVDSLALDLLTQALPALKAALFSSH